VGVEEGTDGPDVAPIALEEVGLDPSPRDLGRDDIAAKIDEVVVEGI
jgi:hypothetical protein